MAKMSRKRFKKQHGHRSNTPLYRVHTDIAGPVTPTSHNGDQYALIFVDDATRFVCIYTIKSKDQAINGFKQFVADMGVTEKQIRILRSDNGKEFCNKEFEKYLLDRGILHETTNTYTPEENGVAERTWRILFNMARAMLISSGLDRAWWHKAIKMAAYIRNRILSSALPGKTPYEAMFGTKPNLSHMHPFGSPVYVKQTGYVKKLEPKATEGRFIGYPSTTSGYNIWLPH
jgi:transposase InsO family protein